MAKWVRVEIVGASEFWRKAVVVEWRHRHPGRTLLAEAGGFHRIETAWLEDLEAVARCCRAQIVVAPEQPSRLAWLRRWRRRSSA